MPLARNTDPDIVRVAYVSGPFPEDMAFASNFTRRCEVTLLGSMNRPRWMADFDPTPPTSINSRSFTPPVFRNKANIWWYYPGLAKALDHLKPNVIHVVSEPWGVLAQQVTTWCNRDSNSGVALVLHGCDRVWWHGYRVEQAVRRMLSQRSLSRANSFVAESPEAISRATEIMGTRPAVTATIHTNSRDPKVFDLVSESKRMQIRRDLGLPTEGVGIGFLGKLLPEKGAADFFDAIETLSSGSWWAAVAGSGPEEQPIRERSAYVGASFLGGLRYPDEVVQFLQALDVLVVPSYTTAYSDEQSPRVVIEASMAGCHVIGSTCGAIPMMLAGHGSIFEERNVEELASRLRSVIESPPSEAGRLAIRNSFINRYSPQAVAAALESTWHHALDSIGSLA